jgi:hypothetical protein
LNKHEHHKNKQVSVSLDGDTWSWSDNTLIMVELHTDREIWHDQKHYDGLNLRNMS